MASQVVASSSTAALQRQAGNARLLVAVRPSAGSRSGGQQQQRRRGAALRCAASVRPVLAGGEIVEVKALNGIRIMKNEDDSPRVEYLVQWKDDSPDTW